jgi:hypothetical protein
MVSARTGRTLDQFAVPLNELHQSLVDRQLLENETLVRGSLDEENAVEAEDPRSEAERLRLQLAQQDTARVSIAPLPSSFMRLNINAVNPRSNNISTSNEPSIPAGTSSLSTTTFDNMDGMNDIEM